MNQTTHATTTGSPMHMLISEEIARYTGRISAGNTTFWIRLEFSTRQFVLREIVSAKAPQTTMPASMMSATSIGPW